MTKRAYFTAQTIVFIITALILIALYIFRRQIPSFPVIFGITIVTALAEIIEAFLMAWRFKVAEKTS
jgi:hypothetical protein